MNPKALESGRYNHRLILGPESDEPKDARHGSHISGVRQKTSRATTTDWLQSNREIAPKRFLLVLRYHYPFVIFPQQLESELRAVESKFGVKQRGEGSNVYEGRLVATLAYRIAGNIISVRDFSNEAKNVLDRFGVELMGHEISRV